MPTSSEERLRVAMDAGDLGTWEWNIQTGGVVWSETLERIHGFEQGAFGGTFETYQSYIHEDDREAVLAAIGSAVAERKDYFVEYRMYKPDGSLHWVSARGRVFADLSGQPHTMSGICMDVTDRRRATDALSLLSDVSITFASSLDYEKALPAVASLCVPQLGDWCAVDIIRDDGALQRMGTAKAPGVDVSMSDQSQEVVRTSTVDFVPEVLDETLRRRGVRSYICLPLIARGRTVGAITLVNANPRRPHDIRDLKLAEELAGRAAQAVDNAQLYGRAVDASRAKDEFLATLSHELRTPLTSVLGFASLLEMGGLSDQEVRTAIDAIKSSAHAQARLVEDILDVSRAVMGKLRIEPAPIDLAALVRAATEAVVPAARAKHIELTVTGEGAECMVLGDPTRLQQVTWNLVSNALRFTPPGGKIDVNVSRAGSHAELKVRDTGSGIKAELLPLVFERFRQGETSRELGGLGLGLAIVRHLVELHGGTVDASSDGENRGSTFTVRLPLIAADSRPLAAASSAVARPS